MGLQFAPERDSLEQRAGDVEAGKAKRQRRVQVKVAIDERGREKAAARVDRLPRLGFDSALDRNNATGGDRNVLTFAAIGQRGVADNEIEGHSQSIALAGPATGGASRARSRPVEPLFEPVVAPEHLAVPGDD